MIADDFTYESFRHEFAVHRLTPDNWRNVFDKHAPKFFFCESAWQGGSPASHPWQGKIYASVRWQNENRSVLLDILEHCNKHGIPTVFWNKEDPIHFSDRINDFVRTAALFDIVFTTADECVPLYRRDVGVREAHVLPFAVQPNIFNPIGAYGAKDQVNFAGTWYTRYPERSRAAGEIMDAVLSSGRSLTIYDRMHSSPSPAYAYPDRFQPFTRPAIPYIETANSYRDSRFGITLNTVTDSRTMFARRIFELAACGSVVLSNSAVGVKHYFGDSVIYADSDPRALFELTEDDYRRKQREAMRVAFANTYRHRAQTILRAVGISHADYYRNPQLVTRVRDLGEADEAIRIHRRYAARVGDLLLVLERNSDQTLQVEIQRRFGNNAVCISQRELDRDDYRPRNLFTSRRAIVHDVSGPPIGDEEIDLLSTIGNALSEPLVLTPDHDNRFRFGRADHGQNIIGDPLQLLDMLRGRKASSVLLV